MPCPPVPSIKSMRKRSLITDCNVKNSKSSVMGSAVSESMGSFQMEARNALIPFFTWARRWGYSLHNSSGEMESPFSNSSYQ